MSFNEKYVKHNRGVRNEPIISFPFFWLLSPCQFVFCWIFGYIFLVPSTSNITNCNKVDDCQNLCCIFQHVLIAARMFWDVTFLWKFDLFTYNRKTISLKTVRREPNRWWNVDTILLNCYWKNTINDLKLKPLNDFGHYK